MRCVNEDDLVTPVGPNHPTYVSVLERSLALQPEAFRSRHCVEIVSAPTPNGTARVLGPAIVQKETCA